MVRGRQGRAGRRWRLRRVGMQEAGAAAEHREPAGKDAEEGARLQRDAGVCLVLDELGTLQQLPP